MIILAANNDDGVDNVDEDKASAEVAAADGEDDNDHTGIDIGRTILSAVTTIMAKQKSRN